MENNDEQQNSEQLKQDCIDENKDNIKEKKKSKVFKPKNLWTVVIVAVVALVVLGILEFSNINPFRWIRNALFTDPALQSVTVDVLEDRIIEVFQIVALEIHSSNVGVLEIVPGGFINPGTLTVIMEYDSIVKFGLRDPHQIEMRRIGDVLFVKEASINIEVLETTVRNFVRTNDFKSNPFLSWNREVLDQYNKALAEYEKVAEQRLSNEQNFASAKRSFISTFEAISSGLGLSIIWE